MKITLLDKKAIGNFLDKKPFTGRVLVSNGLELRASWGKKPLIAKWNKKSEMIYIPSEDKGVRKVQAFLKVE